MSLTYEQEQFIADNLGKMKQKDIAAALGISKWTLSLYLNKKRHFRDHENGFFIVDLPKEYTWII